MKSFFPWIVVVGLLLALLGLYTTVQGKNAEIAELEEKLDEMQGLEAELAELRESQISEAELERLRRENEEVHRLRNETGQMRRENEQLTARLAQMESQMSGRLSPQELQELQKENERLKGTVDQFEEAKHQQLAKLCIAELLRIEHAKKQWAAENRKPEGSVVAPRNLQTYFKNNQLPACPAGGTYSINLVGQPPTCTLPDHAIPNR